VGKPRGSIGETKLKVMAILHHEELTGITSYGYGVWKVMKERYHSCLNEDGLRNIYHHLEDLNDLGLIRKVSIQSVKGAPKRRIYSLTEKGRDLQNKYGRYLEVLQVSN
jgi:DNA-binding PadR family transcriptional regulator